MKAKLEKMNDYIEIYYRLTLIPETVEEQKYLEDVSFSKTGNDKDGNRRFLF